MSSFISQFLKEEKEVKNMINFLKPFEHGVLDYHIQRLNARMQTKKQQLNKNNFISEEEREILIKAIDIQIEVYQQRLGEYRDAVTEFRKKIPAAVEIVEKILCPKIANFLMQKERIEINDAEWNELADEEILELGDIVVLPVPKDRTYFGADTVQHETSLLRGVLCVPIRFIDYCYPHMGDILTALNIKVHDHISQLDDDVPLYIPDNVSDLEIALRLSGDFTYDLFCW